MRDNTGKLHHLEIYVSDLKRSVEFWKWILEKLGYNQFQEWESGKSWKLENTYIVFVQAEKQYLDVPYHRKRVGLNHLAFCVESAEQFEGFRKELESRGIEILYKDKKLDPNVLYFEDPDRIKVELVVRGG